MLSHIWHKMAFIGGVVQRWRKETINANPKSANNIPKGLFDHVRIIRPCKLEDIYKQGLALTSISQGLKF
jgi:hypothetical protein